MFWRVTPHPDHEKIVEMTRDLAVRAGQDPASLTVNTEIRRLRNGRYAWTDDSITIKLPKRADGTDCLTATTIAHELGHRAQEPLPANPPREFTLTFIGILALFAGWLTAAALSQIMWVIVLSILLVAALLRLGAIEGRTKHPREYDADAYAARLLGSETVAAATRKLCPLSGSSHPPRKGRIGAVEKLAIPTPLDLPCR